MTYKVYHLGNQNFSTVVGDFVPSDYLSVWDISEEQNQAIELGANMFVSDGELVIEYWTDSNGLVYAEIVE